MGVPIQRGRDLSITVHHFSFHFFTRNPFYGILLCGTTLTAVNTIIIMLSNPPISFAEIIVFCIMYGGAPENRILS